MMLQAAGLLGLATLAGTAGCNPARRAGGAAGVDPNLIGDPAIPWPDPPSAPVTSGGRAPIYAEPMPPAPMPAPVPSRAATPTVPDGPVDLPQGVLARREWTRAGVARPDNINPMNGVNRITIHHDGMDAFTSSGFSQCAGRIEQIRQSHVNRSARGGGRWADIGYHYIIDPAGRVWEGRSMRFQGAHVQDKNENNIGILCLGNYERQSLSRATAAQIDRFVPTLMRRHGVPLSRIFTHRELNPTECPGRNLQQYMNRTRSRGGGLAMVALQLGIGIA
jgi:hypothetical protein